MEEATADLKKRRRLNPAEEIGEENHAAAEETGEENHAGGEIGEENHAAAEEIGEENHAAAEEIGKENHAGGEIGEDILEEIVLRLPIKSIGRFSCFSKSWNSIIYDSRFIKRLRGRPSERILVSLRSGGRFFTTSIKYESMLHTLLRTRQRLISQCEGLFCVIADDLLCLWNPSTGISKHLPPPPIPIPILTAELGYDSINEDYKLLLNPFGKETWLYSLKSNAWRKIPSFHMFKYTSCAYVNGSLHWASDPSGMVVVSFNLSTEEHGELAAPPKCDGLRLGLVSVSVLKGKLCVTQRYVKVKFVLWLMEDYGIGTSWVKMVEIDYCKSFPHPWYHISPIYLYNSGDILVLVLEYLRDGRGDDVTYIYKKEKGTFEKLVSPDKMVCNPKPFWPLNHFTVPIDLSISANNRIGIEIWE